MPRELVERAPPSLEDPRGTIELDRDELTRTSLGTSVDEAEGRRKENLRARGELLK
jgi:hypothetical protein